jgi:AraC-like DNA-binding protein
VSTYRELPPPAVLADWVCCAWVSSRSGGARILPDGCVDLVWTGRRLIVAGPATESHKATEAPGATKVGVRFRVGAAGAALGMPASELRDENPHAAEVLPAPVVQRIASSGSDPERMLMALTGAVSARLRDAEPADPLVRAAARALVAPDARVRTVAERLGLSERQLRRRFEDAVGYGPKVLARVLRLQRLLQLATSAGGAGAGGAGDGGLSRLAFDAGYADQAHLTRECAALTGVTPGALLAERRAPAGDAELRALALASAA